MECNPLLPSLTCTHSLSPNLPPSSSSTNSLLSPTPIPAPSSAQLGSSMAATTANAGDGASRFELQAAIAKAVELRAIHAALMHRTSPSQIRPFPSSSSSSPTPISRPLHDYPVFTPSYEDEPLPGYRKLQLESRVLSEGWDDQFGPGIRSSRKELGNFDSHSQVSIPDHDLRSVTSSCNRASPSTEPLRSRRRNSLGEFKPIPHQNDSDSLASVSNGDQSRIVIPLTDSHMANHHQSKTKAAALSWLFPRLKKKAKPESHSDSLLRKQLIDANQRRDHALAEAEAIKSSFKDLKKKLMSLESYCDELKKALKQTVNGDSENNHDNPMPVTEEAMAEGFTQIASEARLSVKHFCKILAGEIQESDDQLMNNLNTLLEPYNLSITSKNSKSVQQILEAIINQELYQDFENCVFKKNGAPKLLDPDQNRQAQFAAFVALRNLSWNEVLRKGTKYYSEELSGFCDEKMSCIISKLRWMRPWSEALLQAFFVAAKCVWLLHLLGFSFRPAVGIMRVEEGRAFERRFMEDAAAERRREAEGLGRVKVMVMVAPGFYVQDRVLRCRVVCRYDTSVC